MESYIFIVVYGICCPWLIFFSAMLYLAYYYDKCFSFVILSHGQLFCYWVYVLILLVFSLYFFGLLINSIEASINVLEIKNVLLNWLKIQPWQSWLFLLFLLIFVFGCIVFSFLLLKWVKLEFRKWVLTLYLYYCQYDLFLVCSTKVLDLKDTFRFYLQRRVSFFTENTSLLKLAYKIWPRFFYGLASKIFPIIVPYTCVFDYLTQQGVLTNFFLVLSWCYIYYIIIFTKKVYFECVTREHMNLTKNLFVG